jgi:broad specificity phosphatase PhoE
VTTTTLVLARHGEAEYEANEWGEGGSLTPIGRRQSQALARALSGEGVTHVYASTLARAVQTAEVVAARLGVGVTTRTGLREFDPGYLVERPHDLDPVLAVYDRWIGGDLDARVPDGESAAEVVARLRTVLEGITQAHPGETVLVVSHGGTLRIGLPALCRMDVEPAELDPTATVEVRVETGDRVCVRWGA